MISSKLSEIVSKSDHNWYEEGRVVNSVKTLLVGLPNREVRFKSSFNRSYDITEGVKRKGGFFVVVQPSAMTVSVTHAQVTVTTTTPNTAMMALAMGRPPSPGNSSGSDNDGIANSTSTTALRRLYFKSGRNAKAKITTNTPVPKVVVMGSSSASTTETTINTSTESASTLVTNVTATDTSETCDSLDMGDTSGQSEPLLSSLDEPPQTAVSITSEQSVSEMEVTTTVISGAEIPLLNNFEDSDPSLSAQSNNIPRTAPVTSSVHFPFDPPQSPKSVRTIEKNQSLFTFTDAAGFLEQQQQQQQLEKFNHQDHHVDKHFGQQHQHQHPYRGSQKRTDDKEMIIFSRRDDDDKENRTRKETQSKFGGTKDSNKSSKDNNGCYGGSGHDGGGSGSSTEIDDSKKQKKDTRLKTRSNRYINALKTSPKKDKYSGSNNKINSAPAVASKEKYFNSQKHSTAQNNHERKDLTMFPFDREAIDYERIQRECFAVDEIPPQFPYDAGTDSDTESDNDSSVYERKPYIPTSGKLSSSSKNDVFQQYTLLSQQEVYTHEKRPLKRNRPDLIHSKYDHIAKSDAFVPKSVDSKNSPPSKSITELLKFEQIASKFDQIPPKSQDLNAFHHHYQESSLSISNHQSLNGSAAATAALRVTPPLPDLRVDFFAESAMQHKSTPQTTQQLSQTPAQPPQSQQQPAHDILGDCQKLPQNAGAINVTANPMETAVCTPPRATIVVQQASLSLDNTVETFLLKNEGDFVSVEQAKESRKKKQQREENMRQLLDVTNTLTFEELRDFEMRYGSPHHSRSQSVKTPGSRASGRPNQLSLPQQRSRVASMPNTGVEEEYYRLRHFSITGKGVVNRGDSLKSRRSRSNNSVASSNSSTEHLTANQVPVVGSARTSATCSLASSRESSTSNPGNGPYRVLMLGSSAVGKSSLVSQFMTSEYLHAYDTSIDDESGEKAVSVLLSGEESELIFIDHAYSEMSPENCLSSYDPHGYCVIYSSADRSSFMVAERILQSLWTTENIAQKAVILVGNKADLARSRVITSDEGKAMATAYDCKFIETSVGINHNVDELLVGLLSQIRLKLENPEKSRDLFRKRSSRKSKRRACSPLGGAATACLTGNGGTNPSTPLGPCNNTLITEFNTPPGSAHSSPRKYRGSRTSASLKVKGLLGRVWARDSKSKSCENLHVL